MTEDNISHLTKGATLVKQLESAVTMETDSDKAKVENDENNENKIFENSESMTEHRDAALFLSVVAIATKEIHIDGLVWDDDEPFMGRAEALSPSIPSIHASGTTSVLTPRFLERDSDMEDLTLPPADERFAWSRIRAVSIDSPEDENTRSSRELYRKGTLNIISPHNSPVSRRMPLRKPGLRVTKRRSLSTDSSNSKNIDKRTLPTHNMVKTQGSKTILRKKFSWKNYPELEAFLIANREEYLRHSALNYTMQQKQYNNRLTERLIELAAEHGYVFDKEAFSFVVVRDRIRCYFKSYVQSAKKRGVIIGYAARKAGLLTEEELEKSAGITGRIVIPFS